MAVFPNDEITMGFHNLSKYSITLKRSGENIIIKRLKEDEILPEPIEKFQLSSLFNLLEDGQLGNIQPSLYKITSLDLSYCDLTDLPKTLKFLHLKELIISHNKFNVVPLCLYGSGLDVLEYLDLSFNLISHFDVEPDCVKTLKILLLNNNKFENVPSWFLTFRCIGLEELNYSENKAEHYNFLKHSCNFSIMKLRKLKLQNACLVDLDITWLKSFKNLQYLDISNKTLLHDREKINKFKDLDQLFYKSCWQEMKILKLSNLNISFLPESIFWIESITELHISNNLLSWFPDGIEHLVNLEYLDISCNELIMIPKQISQMVKLKTIIACINHLDGIPPMPPNLEVLDLYDNNIQIIEIESFNSIMFIDLDCNFVCLTDQDLSYKKYCFKRDQFRMLFNSTDRICETKLPENLDESSQDSKSDSSNSDYDYSYCKEVDHVYNMSPFQDYIEDWDRESNNCKFYKHPEITLSDNEYDGENGLSYNNFKRKAYLYTDDEEWMFVDAD